MTTALWCAVVSQCAERIAAADGLFCFFDFDGTLAPLVSTPAAALPLPGTTRLLAALASAPGTHVALISGRTTADLRALLDIPGIYYIGVHGIEIELPNGTLRTNSAAEELRSILLSIKQQLQGSLGGRPGILIEDKGVALACHYRLASRADAATTRAIVADLVEDYRHRDVAIIMMDGHEVVEICPAEANKGTAARALLAAVDPAALAVYVGDDHTDEAAFVQLPPTAITVRVGPATLTTAARYRVDDPMEVQGFLRDLLAYRTTIQRAVGRPAV